MVKEIVHFGVTKVRQSEIDPAIKLSQAVYPEYFSPIETGIYWYENELVFCLSSQVGCAGGCRFCDSSGPFNFPFESHPKHFQRNLRAAEMYVQAYYARKIALANNFPEKPILFSFMGMGEPLDNYSEVKLAIVMLGKTFPDSRTTISTICSKPKIVSVLTKDIASGVFPTIVKLHFSLHAPNDQLRKQLMPKVAPLGETISAMRFFMEKTGRQVKANYILMKGVNDRPEHEQELVALLADTGIVLKVSDFNSSDLSLVVPSEEADAFAQRIAAQGIQTCRFRSLGQDAGVRCGELTFNSLSL